MPEVAFTLVWPDGAVQECVSPSTAIERFLTPGARYPVQELLRRTGDGLEAASERVRAVHGMACTAAAAQREQIDEAAARHAADGAGQVLVRTVDRDRGAPAFPPDAVELDGRHVAVAIVGGGQAGLAVSHCLTQRGVEHLVLERERVAHRWRDQRWDAFCLVTPNWQCTLPGFALQGVEPDGFIARDEIAEYVEGYARSFEAPVIEDVAVTRLAADPDRGAGEGYVLETGHGTLTADQVVLAVGGYHVAAIPRLADGFAPHVSQLHSSTYRNPESVPDGGVLVVGSGQSGAQIAEDLHLAGRAVHLAVGTAPRVARTHRGRDVVAWLHDMGHYDLAIEDHPEGTGARREANHYVTGRGGGHDIDLRAHAADGMTLHGRLVEVDDAGARFAGDLRDNLDGADRTLNRINDGIDSWIAKEGVDAPAGAPYEAVWTPEDDGSAPLDLAAAGVNCVVWATGFRSDWRWVDVPVFDGAGYPAHERGMTSAPGLHVVGLPWLHTWGSGRFAGIARDAEHLAGAIADRSAARSAAPPARAA